MTVPQRNVSIADDAPGDEWPAEAIETVMHRGSLGDWRPLARAIRTSPWGRVARTVEQIAGWGEDPAIDALFQAVIERARTVVAASGRERYAAHVRELRASTGLSLRAFAALAGTSAARLSEYEHGRTSPTTDALARLEHAAHVGAAGGHLQR